MKILKYSFIAYLITIRMAQLLANHMDRINLTERLEPDIREQEMSETNEILSSFPDCKAFKNNQDLGNGRLSVCKSSVKWEASADAMGDLDLSYSSICVHGLVTDSQDPYVMLVVTSAEVDDEFNEDMESTYEIRFQPFSNSTPEDERLNRLNDLNNSLKEGQRLNPDPDDVSSEDDNGMFHDEMELSDEDCHGNGLPEPTNGQFDDA